MTKTRFQRTIVWLLAASLLLWAQGIACATDAKPLLWILRPAGSDPHLSILVLKDYGTIRIPYAEAKVTVTGPEEFCQVFTADLMGNVQVNPADIMGSLKDRPEHIKLEASASLGDQTAQATITVSQQELDRYLKQTVEALTKQGDQLGGEGKLTAALRKYQQAHSYDPSSAPVTKRLALAYEKLGMLYLAVAWYSQYLLLPSADISVRQAIKQKVIGIVKRLDAKPPIPQVALAIMEKGRWAVKTVQYPQAIYCYEMAQGWAPWWPEPYYSEALVFEYLAFQNNFTTYAQSAIQHFELFLTAATDHDPRASDVRSRVQKLRKIMEGLNAPQWIPIK